MIVLVFSPNYHSQPTAIFWAEKGRIRSHVVEEGPELSVGLWTLQQRDPNVPIEDTFMWLSERTLPAYHWDAHVLPKDTTPQAFLEDIRKAA